jgi:hypothetical protein
MPVTAIQLENIFNSVMDYRINDGKKPWAQSLQERPLTTALLKAKKTFPGGKESITGNVKGAYVSEFKGYSDDDTVGYKNPSEIKQFSYQYKELHAGVEFTMTELKKSGISVVNSTTGEKTNNVSEQEKILISNLLEDKMDDLEEGSARSFDLMMHRDGTQDSKEFAGLSSIVSQTPNVGITGGLDRATHSWWRNRALCGANAIVASDTSSTAIKTLKSEIRQLRRFGGKPNLICCGSEALRLLESEYVAKGQTTVTGFSNGADIGIDDLQIKGIGKIMYDPTMDDEGMEHFLYMLDTNFIKPYVMEGEDNKMHYPARPAEKYVLFRAITWTGGLVCNKLNAHGVYEIK